MPITWSKTFPGYGADETGTIWGPLGRVIHPTVKGKTPSFVAYPKRSTVSVAAFVLETLVGPRPEGCRPGHKNGDTLDNSPDNLFWTARKNVAPARGSKHGRAKLNEDLVKIIRERLANGEGQRHIANDYGVSTSTISKAQRTNWSHVRKG